MRVVIYKIGNISEGDDLVSILHITFSQRGQILFSLGSCLIYDTDDMTRASSIKNGSHTICPSGRDITHDGVFLKLCFYFLKPHRINLSWHIRIPVSTRQAVPIYHEDSSPASRKFTTSIF